VAPTKSPVSSNEIENTLTRVGASFYTTGGRTCQKAMGLREDLALTLLSPPVA
jgi:hypothetical protein